MPDDSRPAAAAPSSMISVIMPCFNGAVYLAEAVASVFAQSDPDFELIVVDDGSTDGSLALLRELEHAHGDRLRVFAQDNRGPFPARNLALGHVRGEYVTFLDADDWWDRDFLSKMRRAIRASGADLAYCGWHIVGSETLKPFIPPPYGKGELLAALLSGCPLTVHSVLVRRSLLEAVHGFSTRYRSAMDVDLWLRIASVTSNMARVPEVLAYYRYHEGGQISSVKWRQALNAYHVRRDFIRGHPELAGRFGGEKALYRLIGRTLHDIAYEMYWKRDIDSSQPLFRKLLGMGYWSLRDLKYMLPSLAPRPLYKMLLERRDRRAGGVVSNNSPVR
jgi:glycosyltransferase involved in cell wall biosynthesis